MYRAASLYVLKKSYFSEKAIISQMCIAMHRCASEVHRCASEVHRRCIGVHRVVSSLLSLFKIFTKNFTTKHFHPLHRNASPCIGAASDAHRSASVWIKHSHYGITSIYWFFKNFFHVFLHLCIAVYLHDPYPYPYHSETLTPSISPRIIQHL